MNTRARARAYREVRRTIEKQRRVERKQRLESRESLGTPYNLRSTMGRQGVNTSKGTRRGSKEEKNVWCFDGSANRFISCIGGRQPSWQRGQWGDVDMQFLRNYCICNFHCCVGNVKGTFMLCFKFHIRVWIESGFGTWNREWRKHNFLLGQPLVPQHHTIMSSKLVNICFNR